MTRQSKKESERRTVDELLSALGMTPTQIEVSESPDFMLTMDGRTVGVEVTMYRSGTTVGGTRVKQRKVEAAWESFQLASREFRAAQPDISNVSVLLIFNNVVPAPREHQQFTEEVAAFIRSQKFESDRPEGRSYEFADRMKFRCREFASPLMKQYLHTVVLNRSEFAEWNSSINAGWVAGVPASALIEIVAEKAVRPYRPTDELWLIIQCSHRISETVIASVDALNDISMKGGPFSKIYLLSIDGVFQWGRLTRWTPVGKTPQLAINGETHCQTSSG
jgi:hypothetical protein